MANDAKWWELRCIAAEDEARKQREELATLRLIVTEKFARDIEVAVRPEDAADVAKWARNPGAVRELLSYTPTVGPMRDDEPAIEMCARCGAEDGQVHNVVAFRLVEVAGATSHTIATPCPVATAWRALGDPRGQADIERAHEEALREQERRGGGVVWIDELQDLTPAQLQALDRLPYTAPRPRPWDVRVFSTSESVVAIAPPVAHEHQTNGTAIPPRPFRLASESEQAARERTSATPMLDRIFTHQSRTASDARGIDAVWEDAHYEGGYISRAM